MTQKITNAKLVLLVALGVTIGLFANHLLTGSSADAQAARQFRACTALSLYAHDGAAFANPQWRPRTIAIQRGWTVVGGGGAGNHVYAVACR